MAMPLSSATVDKTSSGSGKPLAILVEAANELSDGTDKSPGGMRYRLLHMLQTSLDLDKLLLLFHEEIMTLVPHRGLLYVNDANGMQTLIGKAGLHSCSYRLVTQGENLGEITLYRSTRVTDAELKILETLLGSLLCPLRNALKYRAAINAAMTDPLTGAGNRLALMSNLAHELNLANRYDQELSLLVLDIDKFKVINDTQGHAAGDSVLQELVRLVNTVNRNTDRCYRYGGEEFVVVLSKTDKYGAMVIAERLREAVADIRICAESGPIKITVSVGAASFQYGDSMEMLLGRADKAMYQIKNKGGNSAAFL